MITFSEDINDEELFFDEKRLVKPKKHLVDTFWEITEMLGNSCKSFIQEIVEMFQTFFVFPMIY